MSNTIEDLIKIIKKRKAGDIKSSYTSLLLSNGTNYCLNKLKEEMKELEDAIINNTNKIHETADVIYHLLVTLESAGIDFDDVEADSIFLDWAESNHYICIEWDKLRKNPSDFSESLDTVIRELI